MSSRTPRSSDVPPGQGRARKPSTLAVLEALLKKDDVEALRTRFVHMQWEHTPADERNEFWTNTWPKLLRRCQKVNAPACYCMLVEMAPTIGNMPLPDDTLAGLLEAEDKFTRFADRWGATDGQRFAQRLATSPQSMRSADWLRMVRLGGLNSITSSDLAHTVEQSAWYAQGWKAWCGSKQNREDALRLMLAEDGRASPHELVDVFKPYDLADVFKAILKALPVSQQEGFGEALAQTVAPQIPVILKHLKDEARPAQRLNVWAVTARKHNVAVHNPVWSAWFHGIGDVIAHSQDTAATLEAYILLRTVFQTDKEDRSAPPGLEWTSKHAHGWAQYVSASLLDHPDKLRFGIHPGHNEALTALFNLERILNVWGLANREADVQFLHSMDTLMPSWRDVIEVQALGEDHIPQMRSEWRAHLLARTLENSWRDNAQTAHKPRL